MTTLTTQFVRLNRELNIKEAQGRFTVLEQGAVGFLITNDNLEGILEDLTKEKVRKLLDELEQAIHINRYPALIGGYVVSLNVDDYVLVEEPVMPVIPGKII